MGGLDRTGQGISEWKSFDEAILVVFSLLSDLLVRCKGSSPSGAEHMFCCLTGAVQPQPGGQIKYPIWIQTQKVNE
jgi:hypothetical protein